jgi:hypothetical protein
MVGRSEIVKEPLIPNIVNAITQIVGREQKRLSKSIELSFSF